MTTPERQIIEGLKDFEKATIESLKLIAAGKKKIDEGLKLVADGTRRLQVRME